MNDETMGDDSSSSVLAPGRVFEIAFPSFRPRITILTERTLKVEIVSGENTGFIDTVAFEEQSLRGGIVLLSWQENIGSTVVHALDFQDGVATTAVTPAKGGFVRLHGRIESARGVTPGA